jgi:hypothetical protein
MLEGLECRGPRSPDRRGRGIARVERGSLRLVQAQEPKARKKAEAAGSIRLRPYPLERIVTAILRVSLPVDKPRGRWPAAASEVGWVYLEGRSLFG